MRKIKIISLITLLIAILIYLIGNYYTVQIGQCNLLPDVRAANCNLISLAAIITDLIILVIQAILFIVSAYIVSTNRSLPKKDRITLILSVLLVLILIYLLGDQTRTPYFLVGL